MGRQQKWMDFIDYGPKYIPITKRIFIKHYGLPKIVVVRTKKNGGIA